MSHHCLCTEVSSGNGKSKFVNTHKYYYGTLLSCTEVPIEADNLPCFSSKINSLNCYMSSMNITKLSDYIILSSNCNKNLIY